LDSDGAFYGTTALGGDGGGAVFRLRIDRDEDGLLEPVDNCPLIANADQRDRDLDGLGDVCDPTPVPFADLHSGSGSEGDTISFTVTLTSPCSETISLGYETTDATAVSPSDYVAASEALTLLPGETSKTIQISTVSDALDEENELFFLRLVSAENASPRMSLATGTILDDDPAPTLSPLGGIGLEGSRGTRRVTFRIDLSSPSGKEISLRYATQDHSAESPLDYESAAGILTMPPGHRSMKISVIVANDDVRESVEFFWLVLSEPTNATLWRDRVRGTIFDDDTGTPRTH
jgi:hypothetical protein